MDKEKVYKYGLYVALILFSLFYINTCESFFDKAFNKPTVKSKTDQHLIEMYNRKVGEVYKMKIEKARMNDDLISLKSKDLKAVHHYHTVYVEAMNSSPDTCHSYLKAVNQAHEQSDSTKNARISKLDSLNNTNDLVIQNYEDLFSIKDFYYAQRGDTINELRVEVKQKTKEVKKAKTQGKLETIGGAILSFLMGLGIGKL